MKISSSNAFVSGILKGMSRIPVETIRQYEKALQKDPQSKIFAPLADAYREMGRVDEAEALARDGIRRHPQYVGGYLALARVFMTHRRSEDAETCLKKAIEVSPENLLAYQLLGQVYVDLKRPQEALKAHKMVLFLNPLSEKSRQAVEKLETLSATEYEDELFEMRSLKEEQPRGPLTIAPRTSSTEARSGLASNLERSLSFIDALIVRNELGRAREMLYELSQQYPDSTAIQRRWSYFDDAGTPEPEESLRPLMNRERQIWERKRALLEEILGRIQRHRHLVP